MTALFSKPQIPATPAVAPPAPIPDRQDANVVDAERNTQQQIMQRAGRASTILTTRQTRPSTNYVSTKLGAGA